MFRLFEINNNGRQVEIACNDGVFIVHELGVYQIEYTAPQIISDIIYLEDEVIQPKYLKEKSSQKIVTAQWRFFENYFGFAKLSINEEDFQLNILGEKFELKEIEEIILYLFERNHLIISKFISKSAVGISSVYDGKDYAYSSKYLHFISTYCKFFEEQYGSFKNLPHTIIRRKFQLSDYNTQVIDFKSIEWILQNLDSVDFDYSYSKHPDAVVMAKNYGVIDKIGGEENSISYNTYENQIILGSFKYAESKILAIKQFIKEKLPQKRYADLSENSQYSDFRDLQIIPFLKLVNEIEVLEQRIKNLVSRYSRAFIDSTVKNKMPKLTPVFFKVKHYQAAFSQIRLLWNLEYNFEGQIHLLNIRKLSELYEFYNLNVLVEMMDELLPASLFTKKIITRKDAVTTSVVTYTNSDRNVIINLYYEPLINNNSKYIDLITIGNSHLCGKHCKPDFVIEFINSTDKSYCVLDSKYSKKRSITENHLPSCIGKYILDIGLRNNPYRKPDFLVILYPDSSSQGIDLIYSSSHFPKIKAIVSKPNHRTSLRNLLVSFLKEEN